MSSEGNGYAGPDLSPLSMGFYMATSSEMLKMEAAAGVGAAAGATFINGSGGSFGSNLTSWQGGLGGFTGFFLGVALWPQVMSMMETKRGDVVPYYIPYVICSGVMWYLQASPGAIIGACAGAYGFYLYMKPE